MYDDVFREVKDLINVQSDDGVVCRYVSGRFRRLEAVNKNDEFVYIGDILNGNICRDFVESTAHCDKLAISTVQTYEKRGLINVE